MSLRLRLRLGAFGDLLWLVGAFVLWSLAFVVLYGVHGAACAGGWASPTEPWPLRLTLIGLWLVMTVVSAAYVLWVWRRPAAGDGTDGFLRYATLAVAGVGAVSTAWLGLPLFLVRVCA
ncbi:hypothetical protein [Phenylobacterium sp.]|uniref:hypothetical protein n=1 Tax=Phenylobacterium sp. TaxID=1871053 RepID=UPI00272FFE37|nr:hypothetical protein [Phenylobacterium sp.]MDP1874680.1 hypothetical protein [Phenylobacterium sp.]MDP3490489.1 hypothetical protein [Phenylobacterium sp.]